MRIVLLGPAGSQIPPIGWGAVESVVWNYYIELKKMGHKVLSIYFQEENMVSMCNEYNPDIVYIMYDDYAYMANELKCNKVYFMSHFAYIPSPELTGKFKWYFDNIFTQVMRNNGNLVINALSNEVANVYKKHGFKGQINVIHNGADSTSFKYTRNPLYPNKSIYLAKIEVRKKQYKYQGIPDIMFAGNYQDSSFDLENSNYLGSWTKQTLYEEMTHYGNLVLLSDGEVDPLVVKEALIAGLGVVVSSYASANLDLTKSFIDVIPDDKLDDMEYISNTIRKNRIESLKQREEIRDYGLRIFSWKNIVSQFMKIVDKDTSSTPSFGAYYQCHKEPYATYSVLENFRKLYPDASIVLVCDNGYDYSVMAKHFNCKYIHSSRNICSWLYDVYSGAHINHGISMIERVVSGLSYINEDYFMWLEDDVILNSKVCDTFQYDINGYCPHRLKPDITRALHESYPHIVADGDYRWSGHGGSIINKKTFLAAVNNNDNVRDVLYNWHNYHLLEDQIVQDYFFSLLVHLNHGKVGPLKGHADGPLDRCDNSIVIQHKYKAKYGKKLPDELAYLVSL